jgi:hypothetical protein
LIGGSEHFWQHRYYDFNVRDYRQFLEKLCYIHRNPVMRGLYERPEQWHRSSYNHYATGLVGRVELKFEWTANMRERDAGTLCHATKLPHSTEKSVEWATRPAWARQD